MLRFASLAALLLLAVSVASCGGGGGSSDGDPATAVPADAPFYGEVVIRPEGNLREDTLAAAGKVLRTPDPAGRIQELVDEAFQDGELDYERDVEPWLGDRAGWWATAESAVFVLAATDTEQALDAIEEAGRRTGEKLTERSYRDGDYFVDADGAAAGVAGDFVLSGPEADVKRTIDAMEGDSLADADRYRDSVGDLADDRLAHFYVDMRTILELAAQQDPATAESLRQFESLIPFDRLPPLTGAFLANGERLALDIGMTVPNQDVLRSLGAFTSVAGSPLVRELPGDSWGAVAWPKVGESYRTVLNQLGGLFGGQAIEQQFRNELGLDLEQDVLSWIGDVAFFVRGTTVDAVDGGAVISVTDADRAAQAFGKIVGVLRTRGDLHARPIQVEGAQTAFAVDYPAGTKPIVLARSEDKVVATYGLDAAVEALEPSEPFGESDTYAEVRDVLGDDLEPGVLLSMPAIVSLVDASGSADAEFEQVRPYLEAFTTIAIGGKLDGNRGFGRIAAGLE
jgi:Protein of unknown function (DUF3352)